MRDLLLLLSVATCLVGTAAAVQPAGAASARQSNGIVRFYDNNGSDRGYLWCLRSGGYSGGGSADCSYYTFEQCQATMYGNGGDCVRNPWSYVTPRS